MRETRNVQTSIFDFYSEHEHGRMLVKLSEILDSHPWLLDTLKSDLIDEGSRHCGRCGLSVESVLRCLLLKTILQISYQKLAFYLSDSPTYRSFTRLSTQQHPSRSGLQSVLRKIRPETLQTIHHLLCEHWQQQGLIDTDKIRIDSTVVEANIAAPSDSRLLNDSIRVLSRQLSIFHRKTGVKCRFTDQREKSKRLAFAIFYAKNPEKQELYPKLLSCAFVVLKQGRRALDLLSIERAKYDGATIQWVERTEHHLDLLCHVIHQTQQRVIFETPIASSEKVFSIFEPHADIIVKGARDVQYGHKINLATELNGVILYMDVLDGNPADKTLYKPVLDSHKKIFKKLPRTTVADGGYASLENVTDARAKGVVQVAFHKRAGLGYHAMGVKRKTLKLLRAFRAGVEGNISELKRAFGLSKAQWKNHDGFKAFVWSGVLAYNLVRMVRLSPD